MMEDNYAPRESKYILLVIAKNVMVSKMVSIFNS